MKPLPALLVATLVVLVGLTGSWAGVRAIAGFEADSDRALLVGMPFVVLWTGMLFPLAQRLESGGSGRRRAFRRALIMTAATAAACELVAVVELLTFGAAIEDSTAVLLTALALFVAPMFIVPTVLDRRFPRPAERDDSAPPPALRH